MLHTDDVLTTVKEQSPAYWDILHSSLKPGILKPLMWLSDLTTLAKH